MVSIVFVMLRQRAAFLIGLNVAEDTARVEWVMFVSMCVGERMCVGGSWILL